MIKKGVLRVGELLLGRSQFLTCEDLFSMWLTLFNAPCVVRLRRGERTSERSCLARRKRERLVRNVLVPSARSQSVTRMVTLASPSLRLFTTHQAPAPGGQSWHATCGSMMGSQSPRVSELTGQGLNSVMYAQSGNCAGARSPQVAKATIAQIAAILGFMLNLCLHTENYTSTCNLLGGSLPENTAARKP